MNLNTCNEQLEKCIELLASFNEKRNLIDQIKSENAKQRVAELEAMDEEMRGHDEYCVEMENEFIILLNKIVDIIKKTDKLIMTRNEANENIDINDHTDVEPNSKSKRILRCKQDIKQLYNRILKLLEIYTHFSQYFPTE